jgi:hypothetical protein
MMESKGGQEVYSIARPGPVPAQTPAPVVTLTPQAEAEDDPSVTVAPGTLCKRKGCGVAFVSDEENRTGDGEGTICTYHPAPVRCMSSISHTVYRSLTTLDLG